MDSDEKPLAKSKTVWANILGAIALMAAAANIDLGLTPEMQTTIALGIQGMINVVMRAVTHARISGLF